MEDPMTVTLCTDMRNKDHQLIYVRMTNSQLSKIMMIYMGLVNLLAYLQVM